MSGDDYERLGDAATSWVQFDGYRAFMGMVDGHCKALRIDARAGTFACRIYPQRPQACRDLGRGTPECRGEIGAKADRPRRALRLAVTSDALSFGEGEGEHGAERQEPPPPPTWR